MTSAAPDVIVSAGAGHADLSLTKWSYAHLNLGYL